MKKVVLGITGASGSLYAWDLLQKLHAIPDVQTHLVASPWAKENFRLETDLNWDAVEKLADVSYKFHDMGAAIASGSFKTTGMVIVPTSMKTVSAVACGYSDNLITRSADVTLKEQRKLILVPRETPLNAIHLENLTKLARLGVQIIPPIPAFYNHPRTISDIVTHQTMRVLDALGIENDVGKRWGEK